MKVEDAVLYICKKYPIPNELSKARVTKLVYLADWESCRRTSSQLTDIKWYFHNFGPYVDDVVKAARDSKYLDVIETANFYGDKKEMIQIRNDSILPCFDRNQIDILDFVIDQTKGLYWNDFIKYVYSTSPIVNSNRYTTLNLEHFAKNERRNSI